MEQRLAERSLHAGAPVFIRIFKQEHVLELWLLDAGRYRLFDTYPICAWSGALGPKLREGDGQAPEGFYAIRPAQMNPNSHYYRAFNLGFPNAYDAANGRTGSELMIHGACGSVGCYAMSDPQMGEIYDFAQAAFDRGQTEIAIDILPFRPTDAAFAAHATDPWIGFWRVLAQGDGVFDASGRPTPVFACGQAYGFTAGAGCVSIRGSD